MFLKSDFLAALEAAASTKPAAAVALRAGDPRFTARVEAMATMLAMLSQQIDLAEVEPFVKARVGTVLADAALKGVLPLGRAARVQVTVVNPGPSPVLIAVGRGLLDGKGRRYSVDGAATAPANGSATVTAAQVTTRVVTHNVTSTAPFYSVQVPPSVDGDLIAGIDVADQMGAFTYRADYCNVEPGERVFHVETDEFRRLWVRFGAADVAGAVVGHQPANGDVITMTLRECSGAIDLEENAGFALEYVQNAGEAALRLTLAALLTKGAGTPDTETLRLLARYPALHDSNAVFLSNFDFLLRRHLPPVTFLSVWNEQIEEAARGPAVASINALFVAFVISGQTQQVSEAQVRQTIGRADNSYRVAFVAPRNVPVPITVAATVGVVHDVGDVEAQIRAALLGAYGQGSSAAARGLANTFRFQDINALLVQRVVALQDQISDFAVTIGATPSPLPEDFRYVTNGSITVTVTRVQTATGLWNQ
jgi:hypothetical protein